MVYPTDYTPFTPKQNVDDTVFAEHVNALQEAAVRLEQTLGLSPQGSSATVAARLTALANLASLANQPQVQVFESETDLAAGESSLWGTIDGGSAPVVTLPTGWTSMDVLYDGWVVFRWGQESGAGGGSRTFTSINVRLSGSAGISAPLEEVDVKGIHDTVSTHHIIFPVSDAEMGVTANFTPRLDVTGTSTNVNTAPLPQAIDRLLRVTKIRRS